MYLKFWCLKRQYYLKEDLKFMLNHILIDINQHQF